MKREIFKTAAKMLVALAAVSSQVAFAEPLVDAAWVKNRLEDSSVVLIDLRVAEDYVDGHIPGAVNATYGKFGWREEVDGIIGQLPPLETINEKIGSLGIDSSKHVVVIPYGDNSSDVGSATRVYWTFKVLGHDNVSLLDGGQKSWRGQPRYELESGEGPSIVPASFSGSVDQKLLIDTEQLVAKVESGAVLPIDARPDSQWYGDEKHPKARISGAIPNAQRLPQADLVDPTTGKFYTTGAILEVAEGYGWEPDGSKALVSYCNTGHWASLAWFALSEIANVPNVALYDGSMVAWTQDENRPLINEPSRVKQLTDMLLGG